MTDSCTKCELHQTCKTVQVSGEYHARGDGPLVVFVGEAPGGEEDQAGRPFIGISGQMIREAIDVFGIKNAFLTNTVRCRPPENAAPRAPHIKACLPYLGEELESLDPDFVVPLGAVALKAMTGQTGITSWHGRELGTKPGDKPRVFPILHPAHILRDPTKQEEWERGIENLANAVHGIQHERAPVEYKLCVTLTDVYDMAAELMAACEEGETLKFDFETQGTNPYRLHSDTKAAAEWLESGSPIVGEDGFLKTELLTVSFSARTHQAWCVPLWHREAPWVNGDFEQVLEVVRALLVDERLPKVAHNAQFELMWAHVKLGVEVWPLAGDTKLDQFLVDENVDNGLKPMSKRYTDMGGYEDEGGFDIEHLAEEPLEKFWWYNCADSDVTGRVEKVLRPEIESQDLVHLRSECLRFLVNIVGVIQDGVHVDMPTWAQVVREYDDLLVKISSDIQDDEHVKLLEQLSGEPFNKNSPPQVCRLFYGDHQTGVRITKKHEKADLKGLVITPAENPSFENEWDAVQELEFEKVRVGAFDFWFPIDLPEDAEFWTAPSDQVCSRFLSLPVVQTTESGSPSTDEDAIDELTKVYDAPLLKLIWRYRKALSVRRDRLQLVPPRYDSAEFKKDGSILRGWTDTIDGRIHPSYNQTRVVTGRLSATEDGKQHNWPRKDTLDRAELPLPQRMCTSRFEGGCITKGDLSQAELRVVAMDCLLVDPKDTTLRDAYIDAAENGTKFDVHRFVASLIFRKLQEACTKFERSVGKTNNFAIVFQKGLPKFHAELKAHNPDLTIEEAEEYIRLYHQALPAVPKWQKKRNAEVIKHGFIRSFFGRYRRVPNVRSEERSIRNEAMRQGVNARIQMTVADMTNWIMSCIRELFAELNMESLVIGTVHDSVLVDTHPDEVDMVPEVMKVVMERLHEAFEWITVPMILDISQGPSIDEQTDL